MAATPYRQRLIPMARRSSRSQTLRVIGRAWWTLTTVDQRRVAHSIDFGITLEDTNLERLIRAMDTAADLLLFEKHQSGELGLFLQQRGWSLARGIDPNAGDPRFRVPVVLESGGTTLEPAGDEWATEINRLAERLNHCIARNRNVPPRLRDQARALVELAAGVAEAGSEFTGRAS